MGDRQANSLTRGELALIITCLAVAGIGAALTECLTGGDQHPDFLILLGGMLATTFLLFRHGARVDREEADHHAADRQSKTTDD